MASGGGAAVNGLFIGGGMIIAVDCSAAKLADRAVAAAAAAAGKVPAS